MENQVTFPRKISRSSTAGFGLSHLAAALLFASYRIIFNASQFQSAGTGLLVAYLAYLLLASGLLGSIAGYGIAKAARPLAIRRVVLLNGLAAILGYSTFHSSIWNLLGLKYPIQLAPWINYGQPAFFGLLLGLALAIGFKTYKSVWWLALVGMLGFELGFLGDRLVVFAFSGISMATGFHFYGGGLNSIWYGLSWILPFTVQGVIGGSILGIALQQVFKTGAYSLGREPAFH